MGTAGSAGRAVDLAAWWYAATRARSLYAGWAHRLLRRVPWVGPMLRWSQTATFLELLAMLVENQVPLHEGVLLAGRASGDAELARSAEQLAAALGQAEPAAAVAGPAGDVLPPLVRWSILAARRDGALLPALRSTADAYRRRAQQQAEVVRVFLPVALTICVGGSVVLAYGLAVFGPMSACFASWGMSESPW